MYVELSVYLGLGLAVLLVWDAVVEHMHHGELMLIAGERNRDITVVDALIPLHSPMRLKCY